MLLFVTASLPPERQPFREITLAIFLEGREIYRGHDETGLPPARSVAWGRPMVCCLNNMKYFLQRQSGRACKRKADIGQWTG